MEINSLMGGMRPDSVDDPKKRNDEMGKDEFLRLLVTQLTNQDPLSPLQAEEFAAQLAQFTSVEQLINISESLQESMDLQGLLIQTTNSGVAAGLIGKDVNVKMDRLGYSGSGDSDIGFNLEHSAEKARITIRNDTGTTIRTLEINNLPPGTHFVKWDGMTDAGTPAPGGSYVVEISVPGAGGEGNSIALQPLTRGRVDRVTFESSGIRVWVSDKSYTIASVKGVNS